MSGEPEILPAEVLSDPGSNLPAEAAAFIRAYRQASKADATVQAYTSDARIFLAWCDQGFRPLPAASEAVAAFLVAKRRRGGPRRP